LVSSSLDAVPIGVRVPTVGASVGVFVAVLVFSTVGTPVVAVLYAIVVAVAASGSSVSPVSVVAVADERSSTIGSKRVAAGFVIHIEADAEVSIGHLREVDIAPEQVVQDGFGCGAAEAPRASRWT